MKTSQYIGKNNALAVFFYIFVQLIDNRNDILVIVFFCN